MPRVSRRRAATPEFVEASRGARTFPGDRAERYWYVRHLAAYRAAQRLIHGLWPDATPTVVDAGCGEGYGAATLAEDASVTALELDELVALHASRKYGTELTVVRADLCRFPIAEGALHAVVCMQVIEHLYCPGEFVDTAARSLRPDGILIVSTPNRVTFSTGGPPNPFHVHEFTSQELEGLLRTRFSDVIVSGIHHGGVVRWIDRDGGLQHLLAAAPHERKLLPRAASVLVGRRHFRWGRPDASLDLFAVATGQFAAETPRPGKTA